MDSSKGFYNMSTVISTILNDRHNYRPLFEWHHTYQGYAAGPGAISAGRNNH